MRVAELLPEERPREKLLRQGASSLTDVELIAVLLGTGTAGKGVLELAREWLEEAGGLENLVHLEIRELMKRPGVKMAKGAVVAAALEIGRRLAERRLEVRPLLDRPELVADYLTRTHARERVELFGSLSLDARNCLIKSNILHRGARTHAIVEPAEVFKTAINDNAHGIILWHTHPSGDPTPSEDDLHLTKRLAEGGKLLGITVLDHVIVGRGGWVSLRQRGVLAGQ